MAMTVLSVPYPPQTLFSQTLNAHKTTCLRRTTSLITRYPSSKPTITTLCSSSVSSTEVVQDVPPPPLPPSPEPPFPTQSESATQDDAAQPPSRGCKACGREEMEKGCNGEGRIQGGIATVPGFGWWPIKAYRPCPAFVASGGRYKRRGQNMDQVAFGRGEKEPTIRTSTEVESSKKRRDPRRFKR